MGSLCTRQKPSDYRLYQKKMIEFTENKGSVTGKTIEKEERKIIKSIIDNDSKVRNLHVAFSHSC